MYTDLRTISPSSGDSGKALIASSLFSGLSMTLRSLVLCSKSDSNEVTIDFVQRNGTRARMFSANMRLGVNVHVFDSKDLSVFVEEGQSIEVFSDGDLDVVCSYDTESTGTYVFWGDDGNWDNLSNWFLDGDQAQTLPGPNDVVAIMDDLKFISSPIVVKEFRSNSSVEVSVSCETAIFFGNASFKEFESLTGESLFLNDARNSGTLVGYAEFRNDSENLGTVQGNAEFYDNSYNGGVVTGTKIMHDQSTTVFVSEGGGSSTSSDSLVLGEDEYQASSLHYAIQNLSIDGDYMQIFANSGIDYDSIVVDESSSSSPGSLSALNLGLPWQDPYLEDIFDYLLFWRKLVAVIKQRVYDCTAPKLPAIYIEGHLEGEYPRLKIDCLCGWEIPTGFVAAARYAIKKNLLKQVAKKLRKKLRELIEEIEDLPLGLPDNFFDPFDQAAFERICRKRKMTQAKINEISEKIREVYRRMPDGSLLVFGIVEEIDILLSLCALVWPKVCVGSLCGLIPNLDQSTCECDVCPPKHRHCKTTTLSPSTDAYDNCISEDACCGGSYLNADCECACPEGTLFKSCSGGCEIGVCDIFWSSKGVCVPPSNCPWDDVNCRWNCSSSSSASKCGCNSVYVESIFPGDFLDTCQCKNGFVFKACPSSDCDIYYAGISSKGVCVPEFDCPWNPDICDYECPPNQKYGAWCYVTPGCDDKLYVIGCDQGYLEEWLVLNQSNTVQNFQHTKTCDNIECPLETQPECGFCVYEFVAKYNCALQSWEMLNDGNDGLAYRWCNKESAPKVTNEWVDGGSEEPCLMTYAVQTEEICTEDTGCKNNSRPYPPLPTVVPACCSSSSSSSSDGSSSSTDCFCDPQSGPRPVYDPATEAAVDCSLCREVWHCDSGVGPQKGPAPGDFDNWSMTGPFEDEVKESCKAYYKCDSDTQCQVYGYGDEAASTAQAYGIKVYDSLEGCESSCVRHFYCSTEGCSQIWYFSDSAPETEYKTLSDCESKCVKMWQCYPTGACLSSYYNDPDAHGSNGLYADEAECSSVCAGACCTNGSCSTLSEADCLAQQGRWQYSTCGQGDCASTCCVAAKNSDGCDITACEQGFFYCDSPCDPSSAIEQPTSGNPSCQQGTVLPNTVTVSGAVSSGGDSAFDAFFNAAVNRAYTTTRDICSGAADPFSFELGTYGGATWTANLYFPTQFFKYAGIGIVANGWVFATAERNEGFRSGVSTRCGNILHDCSEFDGGAPTSSSGPGIDWSGATIVVS